MSDQAASFTVTTRVRLRTCEHGRKRIVVEGSADFDGSLPVPAPPPSPRPPGRVPRVARMMALAIRFDSLLARGDVADLAELARVGHVTRARITQFMNLTLLAPDIQEEILHLPPTVEGRDRIREWQLRPIAAEPVWARQRRMWRQLTRDVTR